MNNCEKKGVVLVVDDSEINRAVLEDILSADYEVLQAANGVQAVQLLKKREMEISLMLLDIIMPEKDGFEVLTFMREAHLNERIPVVIISSETSSQYIKRGYELGAVDYISRPFDPDIILQRVVNTMALYAKQNQLRMLVEEQVREMELSNTLMIDILSTIVEFRNNESGLHVLRIRAITKILIEAVRRKETMYGLTAADVHIIPIAAALHDIGKISIPESILNKPGKLSQEEFEVIKTHPVIGEEMLNSLQIGKDELLTRYARQICRWHHERWNGEGYPDGLKQDEIPIAAQVVSLADVYDALVSERIYKPPFSHEEAMRMILNGECGSFNPLLLKCFCEESEMLVKEIERGVNGKKQKDTVTREYNGEAQLFQHVRTVSDRTLFLLEQERTKYEFLASMSNEILLEYDYDSDMLTLSDRAMTELGVPSLIANIKKRPTDTSKTMCKAVEAVFLRAESTTQDKPDGQVRVLLDCADGETRWYEATFRTMWDDEEKPRICGIIGRLTNIHSQVIEQENLQKMIRIEPLTGLYNSTTARQLITKHLVEGQGKRGSLVMVDVDNFKNANDSHGHMFGDSVLKQVAEVIRQNMRQSDIAARIGGDEFLIYLDDVKTGDNVLKYCDRLNTLFEESVKMNGFTASIGAALYPEHGTTYDELFLHADQAMYLSKQRGKNCSSLYCKECANGIPAYSGRVQLEK